MSLIHLHPGKLNPRVHYVSPLFHPEVVQRQDPAPAGPDRGKLMHRLQDALRLAPNRTRQLLEFWLRRDTCLTGVEIEAMFDIASAVHLVGPLRKAISRHGLSIDTVPGRRGYRLAPASLAALNAIMEGCA